MKWKKVTSSICFIIALISLLGCIGLSYWQYETPTAEIAKVISTPTSGKNAKKQKIVHGKIPRKKVKYESGVELHSAQQLKKYQRLKQPIYLRGYFTIPTIGVYQPVYEGTSLKTLAYGAGTIKPNQTMGGMGNYAIAAHNLVDWYWGHSFGLLQPVNTNGLNAYLISDKRLYMYRLVEKKIVPKTASMPWTEHEKTEQMLSSYNKQSDYHIKANSLAEAKTGINNPDGAYYYAPDITLYTCYEQPPNYNIASHRILVFGIRRGSKPISKMSNYEKSLFPHMFTQVNKTKVSTKRTKGKKHIQTYNEKYDKKQAIVNKNVNSKLNQLVQKELRDNPAIIDWVQPLQIITGAIAVLFFFLGMFLSSRSQKD